MIPEQSCLLSGEESDVLPKRKNMGRKDWDLQSETEKVSEKRDEKLGGNQPVAVGPQSHRRDSRCAQKGDEDGVGPMESGDRFGRRFEAVQAKTSGIREGFGDDGLRDSVDRRRIDVPVRSRARLVP